MKDKMIGMSSIFISIFLLFSLKDKSFEARLFPVVLLIILIILGIILFLSKNQEKYAFSNFGKVIINAILIFVYIQLLPYIGFIISTTLFIGSFIMINQYPMKKFKVFAFSLLFSFIIWFIFSYLFGITLPEILF